MADYFFEARPKWWINKLKIVVRGEGGDSLESKLESAKLTHDLRKASKNKDYIILHDWYSTRDREHGTRIVKAEFFAPLGKVTDRLEAVGFYNGIPK